MSAVLVVLTFGKVRNIQLQTYKFNNLVNVIILVYQKQGYMDIVSEAAEQSMKAAILEVKSLQEYSSKGEVYISSN